MSGVIYTIRPANGHDKILFPVKLEPGCGVIRGTDGSLIYVRNCDAGFFDAVRAMHEALSDAVEKYGKPGGPWNVPGEPGTWIAKAKEALRKARGEA